MAYVDDLAALETALASGTLQVRMSDGKMITYADADSLLKRINYIKRQIAGNAAPVGRFASFAR